MATGILGSRATSGRSPRTLFGKVKHSDQLKRRTALPRGQIGCLQNFEDLSLQTPYAHERQDFGWRRWSRRLAESRPSRIGPINPGVEQMRERNAENPHVALDVTGAGNVACIGTFPTSPTRQCSTLPVRGLRANFSGPTRRGAQAAFLLRLPVGAIIRCRYNKTNVIKPRPFKCVVLYLSSNPPGWHSCKLILD